MTDASEPRTDKLPPAFRLPPALAARYHPLRVLGSGGMGRVYLAEDRELGRHVALKLIADVDEEVRVRLRREAKALSRLAHPHVVRVYDADVNAQLAHIVMEVVEGEPLSDVIPRGAMPQPRVVRLLGQLADGLQHVHDCELLHRDLKPSNVVLTTRGDAVLIDFGLAKPTSVDATGVTGDSSMIGTPAYLPPEAFTDEGFSRASDVFQLGLLGYALLLGAGVHSPDGRTSLDIGTVITRLSTGVYYQDATRALAGFGPLGALILRTLDPVPANRIALRELAADLQKLPGASGPVGALVDVSSPRSLPPVAPERRAPRTAPRRVAPLALAAVAGALMAVLVTVNRSPRPAPTSPTSSEAPPASLLALRVAEQLEDFDPARIIGAVVRSPVFSSAVDLPQHPLNLLMGEQKFPLDERIAKRRAHLGVAEGQVTRELSRRLANEPFWNDLLALRPDMHAFFADLRTDRDLRLRMLDGLLKLQLVDLVAISQLESARLGVQGWYRAITAFEHQLPPPIAASKDAVPLTTGPTVWITADVRDNADALYGLATDPRTPLILANLPKEPGPKDVRPYCAAERTFDPGVAGVLASLAGAQRPSARVTVRATVSLLATSQYLELSFVPVHSHGAPRGERPLRILFCHPGTPAWWQSMEDIRLDGTLNTPVYSERLDILWGELRATFPVAALPRPPFVVKVRLDHVPGVRPDQLARTQRFVVLRSLSIALEP
jgi:serine/threonine protein kinase